MDAELESVFDEIAQAHRDVLTAMIYSWAIAVRLFKIGDRALLDQIPTLEEARIHKKFLSDLIALGRFFEPRIKTFGPDDLEKFGLERGKLLALITELEEMFLERREIL